MTQLSEILAALDQHDPARAEELRRELGQSTEPEQPQTLLDQLRTEEAAEAPTVSEIPNTHELPIVVALMLRQLRAQGDRLDALDGGPQADVEPEPDQSPGQASQVVTPAPAPESTSAPAPAGPSAATAVPPTSEPASPAADAIAPAE